VQDRRGRRFWRPALPIADVRRWIGWSFLSGAAAEEVKPRCVGGLWLFVVTTSMVSAHIYRDDPPRVTVSCNRLYLSLSKYIRHRLIAKINGKKRSWTCKALCQISVDYSCTCCEPIAMPCHTTPGEASEHARVFLPFSSPPHTCMCIESNTSYK
jgi:hypothetical protein